MIFFKFFASNIFFSLWNHSKQYFLLPQLFFSPSTRGWRQVRWLILFLSYPSQSFKISTRHHGLDGVGRRGGARKQLGSWRGWEGGHEGGANLKDLSHQRWGILINVPPGKKQPKMHVPVICLCSKPVYAGIWNQLPWGLLKVLVTWCDVLQRTVTTEGIWGLRLQLVNIFHT